MAEKLFGTDGVRGIANQEPMTAETTLKLGRALAFVALSSVGQRECRRKILVGKDTRLSGYMLENALSSGICSMGMDVLLVGPMPTPGVAFLTKDMRCDAGAVISASHNPFEDNGIKVFSWDGFKLSDSLEERIEQIISSGEIDAIRPKADSIGKAFRVEDALGRYVVFCKSRFPPYMTMAGIKIIMDCANGASYKAAPLVFDELGACVETIGVLPDGRNINLNCGSLCPERVCDEVRRVRADIGIALDGDGDRVILVDEKGNQVDGDQIMGLIALEMLKRNELNKNTIAATVMSNLGLDLTLGEAGVHVVRTPVGDRHVVERMKQDGLNLGGEQSGHLIFLDHATTGDGIIAALQVIRIMLETQKPLSELAARIKKFPQILINAPIRQRRNLEEIPELMSTIRESEKHLGDRGRVLVRFSGTQPLCRVMVEGEDEHEINRIAINVSNVISAHL